MNYITEQNRVQNEQEKLQEQTLSNEIADYMNTIDTNSVDNSDNVSDVENINGIDNENMTNTNSNNEIANVVDGNVVSNIVNDVINPAE